MRLLCFCSLILPFPQSQFTADHLRFFLIYVNYNLPIQTANQFTIQFSIQFAIQFSNQFSIHYSFRFTFPKLGETHTASFSSYRGAPQILVQAQHFHRYSHKTKRPAQVFIFLCRPPPFYHFLFFVCSFLSLLLIPELNRCHTVSFFKQSIEVFHILITYAFCDGFYRHIAVL